MSEPTTVRLPTRDELEKFIAVAEASQSVPVSQNSQQITQQNGNAAPTVPPTQGEVAAAMCSLRGVVAEVALYNETLRYPWGCLRRVYALLIDACIDRYLAQLRAGVDDDETKVIVRHMDTPNTSNAKSAMNSVTRLSAADTEDETAEILIHPHEIDRARAEIHDLLDRFDEGAPFTVQRLSELVLEPEKQYTSLDKYLNALTVVLSVSGEFRGLERLGPWRTEVVVQRVNE